MLLLTCKQFLQELNDYLEDMLDPKLREELRKHVNECPNCWVVCDTTQKTLRIYKGMDAQPVPHEMQERLLEAIRRKMAEKCSGSRNKIEH
jgi:anti-sigma factor (TIGR02949 family)